MKLWSIQPINVWGQLQRDGVFYADPEKSDAICHDSYVWMVEQMCKRLPVDRKPPTASPYPIWAWYQWRDEKHRRPDLRATNHLPTGTHGVRLELEIPDEHVLLSDFSLWHFALNYWHLPKSMADLDAFNEEMKQAGLSNHRDRPVPDYNFHRRIEDSWLRIFDLDWYEKDITDIKEERSIQATFWVLSLDYVRKVTPFTAR